VGSALPDRNPIRGTFPGCCAAEGWVDARRATANREARIFALIDLLLSKRSPTGTTVGSESASMLGPNEVGRSNTVALLISGCYGVSTHFINSKHTRLLGEQAMYQAYPFGVLEQAAEMTRSFETETYGNPR
jgi:hypothetical protein